MKDPDVWVWATGALGTGGVTLLGLLARGCKGYVEDIAKKCKADNISLRADMDKIAVDQKSFVEKDYIKDEIKPILKEFGEKLDEISTTMVSRTEHNHALEQVYNTIDRRTLPRKES